MNQSEHGKPFSNQHEFVWFPGHYHKYHYNQNIHSRNAYYRETYQTFVKYARDALDIEYSLLHLVNTFSHIRGQLSRVKQEAIGALLKEWIEDIVNTGKD